MRFSRSVRRLAVPGSITAVLIVASCSSSPSTSSGTGAGGAPISGATSGVGTGGTGGHGGAGGSGSTTSTTSSTSSGGGATTAGGGGMGGSPCSAGTILCDGTKKEICDGKGGFTDVEECTAIAEVCATGVGCVVCQPGMGTCVGDVGKYCVDDGSHYGTETCDPLQGTTCNPGTGRCDGACGAKAIGKSYIGCEYFPTVTSNIVASIFHFAVAVSNTTATAASVTITRGASMIAMVTVAPNSVEVVNLPWVPELKGGESNNIVPFPASVLVAQGAYRLRSTQPVTVYQFNSLEYTLNGTFSYTNDASLLLPTNAWTSTYRVVARHHWVGSSGLYAVTAKEDGTLVTVAPGPNSGIIKAGVAGIATDGNGQVTLNAGDVIEVVTDGSNDPSDPNDVTGTLVKASKPVQVIGGHQCTNVPDNIAACDHLEESMFPYETLANDYLVTAPLIPTGGQTPKVEMVRIVATQPNTTLTYDPPQPGAPGSIAAAGAWIELADTIADFQISANQPILVAQYMEGQQAGGNSGDPAMTLAVAKSQYRNNYLFHAPTTYDTSYVNIVAPTGTAVMLDGQAVAGFVPIGNTGFAISRQAISNAGSGNHNATGAMPFGISVYGYGQYTSYWYPGGSDLTVLHK